MNKSYKEMLRKNNEREKEIFKSNDEIYTAMVVYLRGSDMTMYNQELVREDLIQMILDGQDRGEDIQKVMGGNYKEVCDEIIENMPKRTKAQKAKEILEASLSYIWIIGGITIAKFVISDLILGDKPDVLPLSVGDIINMVLLILFTHLIMRYMSISAFKNSKHNKVMPSIKLWIICTLFFGTVILNAYFLDTIIITIPIITAIVAVGIIFIVDKLISIYIH